MKKTTVPSGLIRVGKGIKKHSPEILTGIGIAGMITTTVLAVKATPKAIELIEEKKEETGNEKLSAVDTVKVAWKPYIPAAVTGVCSVACIIGANSVHIRRNAALATAYQLSTTAFNEYKDKVVETIGEKKEKTVRENIAKDKITKDPVSNAQVYVTGNGKSLFYDPLSGRYFESDINTVRKAVNDLNWSMNNGNEMYISLSQMYDEIGLPHTSISDDIGWKIDDGNIDLLISAQVTDDDRPCLVMDFTTAPTYDFDKYY